MFYFIMVWVLLALIIVSIFLLIIYIYLHTRRFHRLRDKLNYMERQNEVHFKTIDKTINDTRKERDYWKQKALNN